MTRAGLAPDDAPALRPSARPFQSPQRAKRCGPPVGEADDRTASASEQPYQSPTYSERQRATLRSHPRTASASERHYAVTHVQRAHLRSHPKTLPSHDTNHIILRRPIDQLIVRIDPRLHRLFRDDQIKDRRILRHANFLNE